MGDGALTSLSRPTVRLPPPFPFALSAASVGVIPNPSKEVKLCGKNVKNLHPSHHFK